MIAIEIAIVSAIDDGRQSLVTVVICDQLIQLIYKINIGLDIIQKITPMKGSEIRPFLVRVSHTHIGHGFVTVGG